MLRVHQDEAEREQFALDLDEIARGGARRMLAEALEAEVQAYIEAARDERDQRGHALVVRNGYAREREILLGAGAVEVRAPRVNDKRMDEDGKRKKRFKSVILPPYMRRSPKVCEVLPLLYLHGLSSGDFLPALRQFFDGHREEWWARWRWRPVPTVRSEHKERWCSALTPKGYRILPPGT